MSFINQTTSAYPATNLFPMRCYSKERDPTKNDFREFKQGDFWDTTSSTKRVWFLLYKTVTQGFWAKIGSFVGDIESLTGNTGGPVFGDSNFNINTVGTGPYLVNGNPATHTLTWTDNGTIAYSYVENIGTAVPSANVLNVLGAGGTITTGSGNTITITSSGIHSWIDQAVSIVAALNTGYFATAAITLTMPATPAQGDHVAVFCDTAGTVIVQANTGQVMRFNENVSSTAGTLTNSSRGDALDFVYRAATSSWMVLDSVGLWSIA